GKVFQQDAFHFEQAWCRQGFSGTQVVLDFTEDPWPALSGTADQQGVGAGGVEHGLGFLWGVDIAVGENRNRYRLLDGGNGLVLGLAVMLVGAVVSVYGEFSDA